MMTLPTKIVGSVYLIRFDTSANMARTLLRFQEHYESPKFRGEIFTLGHFKKWRIEKTGDFTYYTDWTGFNFPSWIVRPFRDDKFNPLSYDEDLLLSAVSNLPEPFYLIAVANNHSHPDGTETPTDVHSSALRHEIAHGLWSTNGEYRAEALLSMMEFNLAPFYRWMSGQMYHPATWLDEAHAYVGQDFDFLMKHGAADEDMRPLAHLLANAFDNYTENRFIGAI